MPAPLLPIVLAALARDPSRRPSAAELADLDGRAGPGDPGACARRRACLADGLSGQATRTDLDLPAAALRGMPAGGHPAAIGSAVGAARPAAVVRWRSPLRRRGRAPGQFRFSPKTTSPTCCRPCATTSQPRSGWPRRCLACQGSWRQRSPGHRRPPPGRASPPTAPRTGQPGSPGSGRQPGDRPQPGRGRAAASRPGCRWCWPRWQASWRSASCCRSPARSPRWPCSSCCAPATSPAAGSTGAAAARAAAAATRSRRRCSTRGPSAARCWARCCSRRWRCCARWPPRSCRCSLIGPNQLPRAGAYAAGALVACYCVGPGSRPCRRPLSRFYGRVTRSVPAAVLGSIGIAAIAIAVIAAAATLAPGFWPADHLGNQLQTLRLSHPGFGHLSGNVAGVGQRLLRWLGL